MPGKRRKPAPQASESAAATYELEVIPGLAPFAQAELQAKTGGRAQVLPSGREDRVRFHYTGRPGQLLQLQRSVAAHRVHHFDVPRPKALLGHQHLTTIIGLIQEALELHAPGSFRSFYISAAGSGSSVFARIKAEIQAGTGLAYTDEAGDLLIAVRRPQPRSTSGGDQEGGWEVAVRLSPRPLSARPWRVCDMPGALNATVANTMMGLTDLASDDRVVNLACGSGTLLIERSALGPFQAAVGCDLDPAALACAQTNLTASGNTGKVRLVRCDAGRAPLQERWASTVCADLPFGMLVGTHETNARLYPRLLAEAGRLTGLGGKLVVITQEVRLFERVAAAQSDEWEMRQVVTLKLPANTRSGYIRPRIYLLGRR